MHFIRSLKTMAIQPLSVLSVQSSGETACGGVVLGVAEKTAWGKHREQVRGS